ncbi:hypothetical protein LUW77_09450 [Streptomyces radiopugnans]|nr:hypothetical protein LUW77_09450 [Streptomyces radiopugnans]
MVLVDNSDTHNTDSTGTWTKADADGQQGYDHAVHTAKHRHGRLHLDPQHPRRRHLHRLREVPGRAGDGGNGHVHAHARRRHDRQDDRPVHRRLSTWVSLGSHTFTRGNDAKLELFENDGGAVVADAVKLVRDTSGETDTEQRDFSYTYDANGNLTQITDGSSGADIDTYQIAYTGLNQVHQVEELAAGTVKETTSYTYDPNGLTKTLTNPDQYSAYGYDIRDLVDEVSVGTSPLDTDPKVTTFTYTPRGQKLRETKDNGNTVDHTYFLDGALKTQVEKKAGGTLVSSHTYAYDPNGNKARDVAKKMNADDHSAYLSSTTDYTYDPVDRLATSVKTGNGA